jgi:outer membrane protein assembly factor BamB
VAGDQIYVATEAGALFALDKDAKIVFEKEPGGEKANIYTTPVAAGDLILVAPYKGDVLLAAYDAAGKQAWTFTPEK